MRNSSPPPESAERPGTRLEWACDPTMCSICVVNAVEIEEAISLLAEKTFDRQVFPYAFLEAFGNKETMLKRLRSGETNKSDLGGVLQTKNIHICCLFTGSGFRFPQCSEG